MTNPTNSIQLYNQHVIIYLLHLEDIAENPTRMSVDDYAQLIQNINHIQDLVDEDHLVFEVSHNRIEFDLYNKFNNLIDRVCQMIDEGAHITELLEFIDEIDDISKKLNIINPFEGL